MQIDQIIVRPSEKSVILQYSDSAGRRNNVVFESTGNASVSGLVSDCEARLPSEAGRADKGEIQQEIEELEYRLKMLKQSIGVV